ncbi:DUF6040 family protein [Butyrivibrio sp.]|uniref:DUF6040 family protein n=1 Tax=Butyrivibrio sp. TaxID=28121 RepID=UPI0034DD6400
MYLVEYIAVGYKVFRISVRFRHHELFYIQKALKVLLISTDAAIVFGEGIHNLMKINLVVLFIFIQLVYLGLLICFDDYFETRNKSCE